MITDIDKIKEVAKIFLYLPVKTDDVLSPLLCVHHPFLSSCIVYTKEHGMGDIYLNPNALTEYQKYMEKEIDKSDLYQIYILIRKPYRLAFIKYSEKFLSPRDLAELLADAWVSSENPNQDKNCPVRYLVKLFERCDKEYLMQSEDYKVYQSLPEKFTIYRGVALGRNPRGLSWTQNIETAKWFASRFDNHGKKGYVQTATISKNMVLAYFNTRNEDEIVCNVPKKYVRILDIE